jgi:hypothetical protein
MEKSISLNNIKFYQDSRDNLFNAIGQDICKECSEPQKAEIKIDYINPLNCECRCERVKDILIIAEELDLGICKLTNDTSYNQ